MKPSWGIMSNISYSHKLAHKAVLAVSTVLSKVDALSESIKNDYGEDLIVQTALKDVADNFTLLIQVKGTGRRPDANGAIRIPLEVQHLFRWASHGQPVLVCVFSELTGDIFAFSPRDTISLWEISTSTKATKVVRLDRNMLFDESSAVRFIWKSRIEYYARMLAWSESKLNYDFGLDGARSRREFIEREANLVAFNFLRDCGILTEDSGIAESFRQMVENASRSMGSSNNKGGGDRFEVDHAIILALLGQMNSISSGLGLPAIIMNRCSSIVLGFFRNLHPDVWRRIEENLS